MFTVSTFTFLFTQYDIYSLRFLALGTDCYFNCFFGNGIYLSLYWLCICTKVSTDEHNIGKHQGRKPSVCVHKMIDNKNNTECASVTSVPQNRKKYYLHFFNYRSVNQIVLLRNGSRIFVRTYNPIGGVKQISAPLSDVSCLGSRLG